MLAIVPSTYNEKSFWDTARNVAGNFDIMVLSSAGAIKKSIQFGWSPGKKDKDKGTFKHIGIGMEGASNVNQKEDETELDGVMVSNAPFKIGSTADIRKTWFEQAKKHIQSWIDAHTEQPIPVGEDDITKILEHLGDVLTSVEKAIGNVVGKNPMFKNLQVFLFQQPEATQMVFTSADVFKKTGQYYIRNNKVNTHYADPPENGNWFCAIPEDESYMVPSYGQNNLFFDNTPGKTPNTASRMLREDVGQVVLTNLTLP